MSVYNPSEIVLFGKRFPIYGPLRRTLSTPFAGKVTIGDYSRDDQVITSSWVLSSFSGGTGIRYGEYPRDMDRYYFGTLNPMYARQLMLPTKVRKVSNLGPADVMIDYNQQLFFTVGSTIYRWNEAAQEAQSVGPPLSTPATDIAVYFGKLYILTANELVEHDITDSSFETYTNIGGVAMVGWDDKLFVLNNMNQMFWTIVPSTNIPDTDSPWEEAGSIPLPPGYCRQLLIYQDLMGEPIIFANTRVGLWAYDFDARRFYKTAMTFPPLGVAGKGAIEWRGELRIPAGLEGYLFNNNVVQPAGPNRNDGLPEAYRGNIDRFVAGHAFYYCLITVPGDVPEIEDLLRGIMPIETSIYTTDTFVNPATAQGAVLMSPGSAWHVTHLADDAGGKMGAAIVADIENTYRLWFSTGSGLFWTDSPTALHNPLQIPDSRYEQSGYLETPWFDAGWQEISKLALSLEVFAENVSKDNYIDFLVAWDGDDTWHNLGRITKSGRTSIQIGESAGRPFLSTKLRIQMRRTSGDDRNTPVLRNLIFTFTRQPRKLWGWQFTIRLADDYDDRTVYDMYADLMEIANAQTAGLLSFEDDEGQELNTRVLVSDVNAVHRTGPDKRGQFIISVIEMDSQPRVGEFIHG